MSCRGYALDAYPGTAEMSADFEHTDGFGFNIEARPLCPFCSKPWGDHMIETFAVTYGSESCGHDTDVDVTINCDGCGRLIYQK